MPNNTADTTPQLLAKTLTLLPVGVVLVDQEHKVVWCNDHFGRLCGESVDNLSGMGIAELRQQYLPRAASDDELIHLPNNADQADKWLKMHEFSLVDENVTAIMVEDVSQRHAAIEKFQRLSTQLENLNTADPVTGLHNRRAMLQNLEPLVSRCRRYHNPLSVIAIQFINFSHITKDHGQTIANQSIVALAHLLRDQIRWADIINRPEDDQIVLILPETDKTAAHHLANKIKFQVEELNVHIDDSKIVKIEASYGIAAWEKGFDAQLLLRNAKQLLAEAVNNGPGSIQA